MSNLNVIPIFQFFQHVAEHLLITFSTDVSGFPSVIFRERQCLRCRTVSNNTSYKYELEVIMQKLIIQCP